MADEPKRDILERLQFCAGPWSDYSLADDAKAEIERLRSVLDATHKLISEGAMVGFVPTEGTWADRLFKNQAQIHAALNQI